MDDNVDINRTWESIAESMKTSAQNSLGNFEKLHYPQYEEWSEWLDLWNG